MFPYDLDLNWVLTIQSLGDWLIGPMKFLSFLGTEEFYILILPVLYWCVGTSLGIRVGAMLLVSNGINFIAKAAFAGPRPYWYSAKVTPLWAEPSFGIPSGHAQFAVAIWGAIAAYFRRAWIWVLAIFLMLAIGLSRPFLGTHFFVDIFSGWLIGILTLWLYVRYWDRLSGWVATLPMKKQILNAFLLATGMMVFSWLTVSIQKNFVFPEEWMTNALRVGDEGPDPLALSVSISSAATLFGLLAGVAWLAPRGGWQVSGPAWKRLARYVVGLIVVFVIWNGLGVLFPRGETFLPLLLRFVRYSLLGIWVSAGAPLAFTKLKLS